MSYVSLFLYPNLQAREIPWGSERLHLPSLLPIAVICFPLALESIMEGEREGEEIETNPRVEPDVS